MYVCMCVCVRVCAWVCVQFSTFQTPITQTAWEIDMKFGTPVKQGHPFNRNYFHNKKCPVCDFMIFWIFWNRPETAHKYNISIMDLWYWIWLKSIGAFKFMKFWIYKNFSPNCQTQENFRVIELKFCARMQRFCVLCVTEFCENQSMSLNIRRIWIFDFFLSWHQILKIWCRVDVPFLATFAPFLATIF